MIYSNHPDNNTNTTTEPYYDRPRNFNTIHTTSTNTTTGWHTNNNHIRGNSGTDIQQHQQQNSQSTTTTADYLTCKVFKRRPDLLEEIMKNINQILAESK